MTEAATADSKSTTKNPVSEPGSKGAWAKLATHKPILPSGAQVTITIPNLPSLIKAGEIPNELLTIAVKQVGGEELTVDEVKQAAAFNAYLVATSVKKPEITEDDVPNLPYEDVQMIVEFATRQRDVDALGRHLAGLETTEEWQKFRDEQLGLARALGGTG